MPVTVPGSGTPDRFLPAHAQEPPNRPGISTCLLGEHVRHDGGHPLDRYSVHTQGQYVEWVPACLSTLIPRN